MISDPALYGSVMFHGAAMLPRLRGLSFDQLRTIADEAGVPCCEFPLWMQPYASEKRFLIPAWGESKLSGCQLVALIVFTLWVMVGEREDMASSLCETWPIKEAVAMAGAG